MKGNEVVAILSVKLKVSEKRAENVADRISLKDGLQLPSRGHVKLEESITQVRGAINRFSADSKENREYVGRCADEKGRKGCMSLRHERLSWIVDLAL